MSEQTPTAAPARRTNTYAVVSLVLGIVAMPLTSIPALIFGYKARNQIDASGGAEDGRGLAIAGIVLGWVGVALGILVLIFVFLALAVSTTSGS